MVGVCASCCFLDRASLDRLSIGMLEKKGVSGGGVGKDKAGGASAGNKQKLVIVDAPPQPKGGGCC
jgi:hypothetical protein